MRRADLGREEVHHVGRGEHERERLVVAKGGSETGMGEMGGKAHLLELGEDLGEALVAQVLDVLVEPLDVARQP